MNRCDECERPLAAADGGLCDSCIAWRVEARRLEWWEGARDDCA